MDIIFLTNSISPHQLPFCAELANRLGDGSMAYFYTATMSEDRLQLGWGLPMDELGFKLEHWSSEHNRSEVERCRLLLADIRDIELFEKRAKQEVSTIYISERWFKPPFGILRLLHPGYFLMAYRLARLLRTSPEFVYFPQGIHAARDMAQLCGLMHGDLRCLFKAPTLKFERRPGGRIYLASSSPLLPPKPTPYPNLYCLDKMRMWGYFVESSKSRVKSPELKNDSVDKTTDNQRLTTNLQLQPQDSNIKTLRVLWVGRLLKLKRVDTIIKAVGELSKQKRAILDIYGTGRDENRLKKLATKYGDAVRFYPPVPIAEVRKLMKEHDVYVLASNAYEGWGAVVNEALEEGMKVIGTYEAGSSATILPESNLFHAGDWQQLFRLLQNGVPSVGIGEWSAYKSAEALIEGFVRT